MPDKAENRLMSYDRIIKEQFARREQEIQTYLDRLDMTFESRVEELKELSNEQLLGDFGAYNGHADIRVQRAYDRFKEEIRKEILRRLNNAQS